MGRYYSKWGEVTETVLRAYSWFCTQGTFLLILRELYWLHWMMYAGDGGDPPDMNKPCLDIHRTNVLHIILSLQSLKFSRVGPEG